MSSKDQQFQKLLDNFNEILRKNGYKKTEQREYILRVVYEHKGHFTPEDLHKIVQTKFPELNIGIATIYRTLKLLESENVVTYISFEEKGKKYEFGGKKHHDHLVCDECGKLIEFVNETIEKIQDEIAIKNSFKINSHSMQIHGVCKECQDRGE